MLRASIVILMAVLSILPVCATDGGKQRFIEVNGVSQVELVPDRIHYIVQLREYYAEEFDGAKPEEFKSCVSMDQIDKEFRNHLYELGIKDDAVRLQEVGDYGWRREGEPFYVSKRYDITLDDFVMIDKINTRIDRKAVEYMIVGDLECDSIDHYRRQCRVDALKSALTKAEYMAQALGAQVGEVLQIEEPAGAGLVEGVSSVATSNIAVDAAAGYDNFRTITLRATVRVRFSLKQ